MEQEQQHWREKNHSFTVFLHHDWEQKNAHAHQESFSPSGKLPYSVLALQKCTSKEKIEEQMWRSSLCAGGLS